MIHITIDAPDVKALHDHLEAILGGRFPAPKPQPIDVVTEQPAPTKRTKKVAEPAQPSPVVQPAVTDNTGSAPAALTPTAEVAEPAGASAPAALTYDDVRLKLKEVHTAKGMDAVHEVLLTQGVKKVSDIPADKLAAVFAAAEKVLA